MKAKIPETVIVVKIVIRFRNVISGSISETATAEPVLVFPIV